MKQRRVSIGWSPKRTRIACDKLASIGYIEHQSWFPSGYYRDTVLFVSNRALTLQTFVCSRKQFDWIPRYWTPSPPSGQVGTHFVTWLWLIFEFSVDTWGVHD